MSKNSKRTLSIVSVLVFIGCCAAMIADFNLWWLPVVALPFLLYGNWDFRGTWDSDKLDDEAMKLDEEEPYSRTWPFSALEATPSSDYEKEVERLDQNPLPPQTPPSSSPRDFNA
ncbi:MAG: hypothetical protein HDQ87_04165 [Clostridia bacterium]|nr:hypothetical protein [Clostridia bacterium]